MEYKHLSQIKTGDILLKYGQQNFSKLISSFMWVFGLQNKYITYKTKLAEIPSHTGTFVWLGDMLFICESVKEGTKIRRFTEYYKEDDLLHCKVLTPIIPYNNKEKETIKNKAFYFEEQSLAYGVPSLFVYAIYILTFGKINLFDGINSKFLVCYQCTISIGSCAKPENWKPDLVMDIFDIIQNKNYKFVDFE